MEWLTKIDWAEVIKESASSERGVVALSLIVFGVVVVILFGRSDSERTRLSVLVIIAMTFLIGVWILFGEVRYSIQRLSEIEDCNLERKEVLNHCRAYDRAGFEGSPSASCDLELYAGEGRFFPDNDVFVVEEFYRNIKGAAARDAVKAVEFFVANANEVKLPVRFRGSIGCTNARGTGRTCETRATIQAVSYPIKCVPFFRDLRR